MSERHDDVEAALDEARQDAGLKWNQIAERASVSVATLLRYRKGIQRTDDTTRAIERVFGWGRGYLESVANGQPPIHPSMGGNADDRDDTTADELLRMADEIERQVDELRETIRQMQQHE